MPLAQRKPQPAAEAVPAAEPLGTVVSASEVLGGKHLRLEAAAYGIDARKAVEALRAGSLDLRPLYGGDGVSREAHNAFRFARTFVDADHGVPFLSSSDIIDFRPRADSFLSRRLTKRLDKLLVEKGDVLISCSGTVGNVILAGDGLAGWALTQHVIRAKFNDEEVAGFAAAFLRSRLGRPQLTGNAYGSVVTHIEPNHLGRVLIPDPSPILLKRIGRPMVEATRLRDEANRLLHAADAALHERLNLPRVSDLPAGNQLSGIVTAASLDGRLDASYHNPLAGPVMNALRRSGMELATVGDERVAREVRPITKFRKRVYVRDGGVPMLNSKQLFQIDPIQVKRLASGAYKSKKKAPILDEITLRADMLCVTCSGTVGRVQIIPDYMDGWTASQDAIRLLPADGMAGYLYAWLASNLGQVLLRRHTYGSVVVHIDAAMLASVPVPLPPADHIVAVGIFVDQANSKRHEAWMLEQNAIRELEAVATPGNF